LARGYLNRPELNKTRFIMKPEGVSEKIPKRLYKAGDWGYLLSDGSFEICGRCDSMVKIRGYSIETQVGDLCILITTFCSLRPSVQAVEAGLLSVPSVKACVVLTEGEEGQDKFLVAYVVPENNNVTKKEVRASLKKRLPFFMIPSYFVFLDRFVNLIPKTILVFTNVYNFCSIPLLPASGKLDKKALPPIEKSLGIDADPEGLPTTKTEKALVPIWAEILSLKSVDIQESFFDLGG
jgi:acyl-CoA synthetase (AMP-forming)/AMP-acid ligase II